MKLTKLQRETLALVDAGKVSMHNTGHGSWRIFGAPHAGTVGVLVKLGLVGWGPLLGRERRAGVTFAGRDMLSPACDRDAVPAPGSPEAVASGCTCAVIDNAHGRGYMGVPGSYVRAEVCPLHGSARGTSGTGGGE